MHILGTYIENYKSNESLEKIILSLFSLKIDPGCINKYFL